MSISSKSRPVVIRFKKWKAILQGTAQSSGQKAGLRKFGPDPSHFGSKMDGPPAIRKDVDPDSHRNAWVIAFGHRLKIDQERGFYLDGRPISLDDLMLETNKIRKAEKLDPVGRNPRWIP